MHPKPHGLHLAHLFKKDPFYDSLRRLDVPVLATLLCVGPRHGGPEDLVIMTLELHDALRSQHIMASFERHSRLRLPKSSGSSSEANRMSRNSTAAFWLRKQMCPATASAPQPSFTSTSFIFTVIRSSLQVISQVFH